MGILFLILFFVVEICFSVYSIILKEYYNKTRSVISICYLLSFIFLYLVSVVKWSIRWYAFLAWLLLLAFVGIVSLAYPKDLSNKAFKKSGVIKNSLIIISISLFTLIPALVFPQYDEIPLTGSYTIGTKTYTYTDNNQNEIYSENTEGRKLTVQFWFPENTETSFPLIVFSHGAFGIRSSNLSLYRELASNGYIVCSIDHTYHSLFSTDTGGNTTYINRDYMKEVLREDAHTNKNQSFDFYQRWMDIRIGDINFVIDYILSEADNYDADKVYKLADKDNIGVMGHSLGGSAVLGIGRIRNDIKAVMALESPYLYEIIGVENDEFVWNSEKYPVPVLNVYSDSSWDSLTEWAQYKINADMLINKDRDVHNVYIQGAGHLTLTDLALTSPILTRVLNGHKSTIDTKYCLETINKIALEFFNYYLKGIK